ncbi:DUF2834 domain-containing protein [Oceanicella actignis]|uniref:Uncharacterized protein n=1 Tax=Oceanicella actignis TaxID=1189325 RepID=A0A1M7SP38_9RHOB|nr:DUF2834 domain-containing protein [Oceanicella actignis]TYO90866.1 uncharacterized protein DUF2834 [Oceanicella actignis]SES65167.1 Protein of unknown function [Oceanicella actignis]SHN60232.1 Protein of unknown function [Oceanicella actignis]
MSAATLMRWVYLALAAAGGWPAARALAARVWADPAAALRAAGQVGLADLAAAVAGGGVALIALALFAAAEAAARRSAAPLLAIPAALLLGLGCGLPLLLHLRLRGR